MHKLSEAALENARNGLRRLSPTEVKILGLAVNGRSAVEIGNALGSSSRTVEKHREHILAKCGVANMIALARLVGALENDPVMAEIGSLSIGAEGGRRSSRADPSSPSPSRVPSARQR